MNSIAPIESEKPVLFTMRWIAAMFVAFGHAYSMIFHEYVGSTWSSSTGGLLEHVALMRSGAVIIFFVISGYLVGGSILGNLGRFRFPRYFINRFSRIYIVLLPALLLTAALDWTAYVVVPGNEVYTTPVLTDTIGLENSVYERYDAPTVLTSLMAVDSIFGEPIGSNIALWSLGIEWCFYFLFPAALLLVTRVRIFGALAPFVAAVAVAGLLSLINMRWIASYWVVWVAGAFCSQIRLEGTVTRFIPWIALTAALAMFLASNELAGLLVSYNIPPRFAGAAMGIGFALFLTSPRALTFRLNRSLDKTLADFSYSLYVTHEPVLMFSVLIFVQFKIMTLQGFSLSWTGGACFLAAGAAILAVAYAFGRVFESRTDDLKKYLSSRLAIGRPSPARVPPAPSREGKGAETPAPQLKACRRGLERANLR